MTGIDHGGVDESPLPPAVRKAIADALAAAAQNLRDQPFQVGHRVVYTGPDHDGTLRGKHGTVVEDDPPVDGFVGVQFDGHGAVWGIAARHLAHLALDLHDPMCDCPAHLAATASAVAAVRTMHAVPSLVQLDRDDVAQRLADAAADVLDVVSTAGGIGHVHPHVRVLVKALAGFRAVTR